MTKTFRLVSPPIPEKSIQREIVEGLRRLGYYVLEAGKARRGVTCPKCGTANPATGWVGNTKGCPDLLVSRQEWQAGTWLGLEVKTATGTLRPEQKALADAGRLFVVRSWKDVLSVIENGENEKNQ